MYERERLISQVDFHVHYDDSNAIATIDYARHLGVKAVALLDKGKYSDNLGDYINYGTSTGISVIPGIEARGYIDRVAHMDFICLGFDYEKSSVKEVFRHTEQGPYKREMAAKQKSYIEENLGFTLEDLSSDDETLLRDLLNGAISNRSQHFCEIIVRNVLNFERITHLKSSKFSIWKNTIERYSQKPPYTDPVKLDAKFIWNLYFSTSSDWVQSNLPWPFDELINRVQSAGGVVLYSPEGEFSNQVWEILHSSGIDGIMAWHGHPLGCEENSKTHEIKQDIPLEAIRKARRDNLLVLGGSDYTPLKNDYQLGSGAGNMYMSVRRYNDFVSYIKEKNSGRLPWEK